jgi:UDP-N-acetylglucosamine acyltransferase
MIHKTALIHPDAIIEENVDIGPFTIIGGNVKISKGTKIGSHVVIEGDTQIGENCQIFTGAILGNIPQDLKYKGEPTKVIIGNNNIIREYVTINRGTQHTGKTVLGDKNLIMAYAHIAHDCVIGDNVIISNAVTMAGHVIIEDRAIVGGLSPVHQFVRIGMLAMVGGGSRVAKDVPPYCMAAGTPIRMFGLNVVGLERSNFSSEVKLQIKKAYKILFRSKLNTTQALKMLEKEPNLSEEVLQFMSFIRESERGICKEETA